MKYQKLNGNLIDKARASEFDVIAHGCNCFCTMNSGVSALMVKYFRCDTYKMEQPKFKGDINKLGTIDFDSFYLTKRRKYIDVVNAYTQYEYGDGKQYIDYEALALCLRKINIIFRGKHIGLPRIGCGCGGGDWSIVNGIMKRELTNMDVTIVMYAPAGYKQTLNL